MTLKKCSRKVCNFRNAGSLNPRTCSHILFLYVNNWKQVHICTEFDPTTGGRVFIKNGNAINYNIMKHLKDQCLI